MAKLLKIDQQRMSKLECGPNFPSLTTLTKICEKLDVSSDYLLDIE
ncbi:MAG: helix-turn-helix domain-containing protein [Candidatus Thorarchaeota archaeon]